MLLLEQDTTKKGQINKLFLEPEPEFDAGNNKEYEVEAIIDSAVYAKEVKEHLPGLYYLVSWKGYPEEESTLKSSFAVMHLWKMISTFHKDHPEKPTATSSPLNSALPMAKPSVTSVKFFAKQKQGRPTSLTKRAKEWDIRQWGFFFLVLVRLKGFFINSVSFKRDAHSASFFNSVSFRRDVHSTSSSNSVGFYLWAAYCYCAYHLRAIHCHCTLYLRVAHCYYARHLRVIHRHCVLYLWAAHYHQSSGFPPKSPIRLGGFLSDWSLSFSPQFLTKLGDFLSTMLY